MRDMYGIKWIGCGKHVVATRGDTDHSAEMCREKIYGCTNDL